VYVRQACTTFRDELQYPENAAENLSGEPVRDLMLSTPAIAEVH
jgi:hypothetical protein